MFLSCFEGPNNKDVFKSDGIFTGVVKCIELEIILVVGVDDVDVFDGRY